MLQRFYFDTSVFGGVFDTEFEEQTLQLFERVKLEKIICVYSDLTETELVNAPKKVRLFFKTLPYQFLERQFSYLLFLCDLCGLKKMVNE